MINNFIRSNTEDITSLFNEDQSFTNAMRYYVRKGTKESYLKLFEKVQEANRLAHSFNRYIALKEIELKKKAQNFNELEKYSTIYEFGQIYKAANELLKL